MMGDGKGGEKKVYIPTITQIIDELNLKIPNE
jgi:hypothetical protein